MNPILSLLIDGKPQIIQCFVDPEMSLSSGRANMVKHSFALTLDTERIAEFLAPHYLALVRDLKEDDAILGQPDDALGEAGYPDLGEVLKTPALAELVLGSYLRHEYLRGFTWDGVTPPKYWLENVTHCRIADDQIIVRGVCYGMGEPDNKKVVE